MARSFKVMGLICSLALAGCETPGQTALLGAGIGALAGGAVAVAADPGYRHYGHKHPGRYGYGWGGWNRGGGYSGYQPYYNPYRGCYYC